MFEIELYIYKKDSDEKAKGLKDRKPTLTINHNDTKERHIITELKKKFNDKEINELIEELRADESSFLKKIIIHYNYPINWDPPTMLKRFRKYSSESLKKFCDMPDDVLELLLSLSVMDLSISDLKFRQKKENEFELDFEYDIFDSLKNTTIQSLDRMIEFSKHAKIPKNRNKDYIDKDLWEEFIEKEKFETLEVDNFIFKDIIKNMYTLSSTTETVYPYDDDIMLPQIIKTINSKCFYEQQLLYVFLSMIFYSGKHFIVKKCSICNKFFVTTDARTLLCNRILDDGLTHLQQKNKYANLSVIRKMEKDIDERNRKYLPDEERKKYLIQKKKAKKEGEIFEFLLSHFSKEETRKKYIELLNEEKSKKT